MGLFDRMNRVFSSNFNALLEKAEDPKKSIALTLEEMGEQIRAARQEVVQSVAAEKQLRKKVQELDEEVEKWAKRAELAVKHGDDGLARDALGQKHRVTGERDRAEATRGEQRATALELKAELERMEAKMQELEARKGILAAQAERAKAGTDGLGTRAGGKAFEEFRRMEGQIESVDAAVQAQRELDEVLDLRGPSGMSREEVESKFRALEYGSEGTNAKPKTAVEEELLAIKRKVRIGQ